MVRLYKSVFGEVKDVDAKQGIVTGYFSVFGNKDSDGDVIVPGAFKKTLMENGPESEGKRIKHLLQHDVDRPLSKPNVLKETSYGHYRDWETDRKSTRLNSSHSAKSRMPSSA